MARDSSSLSRFSCYRWCSCGGWVGGQQSQRRKAPPPVRRAGPRVVILLSGLLLLLVVFLDGDGLSGGGVLAAPSSSSSSSSSRVALPLLVSIGENPGVNDTAIAFASSLSAETGGRVTVANVTYGVDRAVIFQAVREGRAFGMGTPGTFAALLPAIDPLTAQYLTNDVPFGMSAAQFGSLIRHTRFGRFWKEIYEPLGIRAYYGGAFLGPQVGDWFKKAIAGPGDFRGLRIRYTGNPLSAFPGSILSALGATPVALPVAQIKPSLANGSLDGLEFLGVRLDLPSRFWEAGAKVLHYPGLQGPEAAHFLVPLELAAMADGALLRASQDAVSVNHAFFHGPGFREALEETRRNGVAIARYPQGVVREFYRLFKSVGAGHRAHVARANPLAARIIDEYNAYLKSTVDHDIMAEPGAQLLPARNDIIAGGYVGLQVPISQLRAVCRA